MKAKPLVILVVMASLGLLLFLTQPSGPKKGGGAAPKEISSKAPRSSDCVSCHKKEYDEWHGSHHFQSMAIADEKTVLGNFNNSSFINPKDNVTTRFFKKEGRFIANAKGPDGKMHDYPVLYVFGVEPLQQYMVAFPNGKLQCLSVAWDNNKKQWYHLYADTVVDHKEWIHWSRGGQNWNSMCADCHSTELRKNYALTSDSYSTTFTEINVSCHSCHGDAYEHVSEKKPMASLKKEKITSKQLVDRCARCHSRRRQVAKFNDIQKSFMDNYTPSLLRPGIYHEDGQILDEVYVYGSFLQSKMYHHNVGCTDCHNPHTTKLKLQGNALCLQCHEPEKFNTPNHHHHKVGEAGSHCIDCHMPGKVYMGIDHRRDHSFRVPRPDLSVKYGTPNACVQCHNKATEGNKWAALAIERWHGKTRKPHFSDVLLPAWQNPVAHLDKLIALIRNKEEPAIVRGTVLWLIGETGYQSKEVIEIIVESMKDEDALIRHSAVQAIQRWPAEHRFQMAIPLLKDAVRSVRVRAASLLVDLPKEQLNKEWQEPYEKAAKEYMNELEVNADFAEGRMNLAGYYGRKGDFDKAISALEKVIEINNRFTLAYIQLAQLLARQLPQAPAIPQGAQLTAQQRAQIAKAQALSEEDEKKRDRVKALLKKAVKLEPQYWEGWYYLGLFFNEQNNLSDAERALSQAAKFSRGRPNVYRNWAVSLQRLNRYKDAEKAYLQALEILPNDATLMDNLSSLYMQMKEWHQAEKLLEKLCKLEPNNRQYSRQLQTVKQKKK